MKRILVAIDLREETNLILEKAKEIAAQFQAKLFIVHSESVKYYLTMDEFQQYSQPDMIEKRKKAVQDQLDKISAELKKDGFDAKCILLEGPTADNIIKETEENDIELIIIGSHKHGQFYHLIFGSIHDLLINRVKVPLMIIPPK